MGSGGCTGSADRMKGSWTDMRLVIDAHEQFQKLRICAIIFPQNLSRISLVMKISIESIGWICMRTVQMIRFTILIRVGLYVAN